MKQELLPAGVCLRSIQSRIPSLGAVAVFLLAQVFQVQAQFLSWTNKANLPASAHVNGGRSFGVAALNGKFYTVGGLNWPSAIATVLEYDPTSDVWSSRSNMLSARYAPAAAAINGKIYAFGGSVGSSVNATATVEEYDPVANTWASKASMFTARFAHAAVAMNGKIYVIGGRPTADGPTLASVEEFDPVLNTWSVKADMPTPRLSFGATALNGKIYVVGGGTYSGGGVAAVYSYDPSLNMWATNASLPTMRGTLATVTVNGTILAMGGDVGIPGGSAAVEEYNPASNVWTIKTNMPTTRNECFAVVMNDKVFVFGGYDQWTMEVATIAPGFCSPHKATATAQVVNGYVVGAWMGDGGCGYSNAPLVLIQGGGGAGATATATVNNGTVTSVNIVSAGSGYSTNPAPKIVIASPPFEPSVGIAFSRVNVTQHVVLGRNYVLETSTNLLSWSATGPSFNAVSENYTNEFMIGETGAFFRLREVP